MRRGGEDTTLFWLKLDRNFKLAGKQAFGIEDCWADRIARIEIPGDDEEDSDHYSVIKAKDLPWTGDILRIEYDEENGKAGRLTYDRKNPEAGFQIAPLEQSPAGGPAAPGGSTL